jgi:23S rRNA (guanosine2251-2'-O)-methyltransferase
MRRDAKVAVIEGTRPVIEALRAGRRQVFEVFVPEGEGSPARRELESALAGRDVRVRPARSGDGVHARAEPYPEEAVEDLLAAASPRLLVALDRVTDVGNLGSIARTAEAAGVTGLVLEHQRSAPISAGALRASAGALEHLRVGRTPNLGRALDLARAEGLEVLVADAGGTPIDELHPKLLSGELVWVLGSEDRGTREALRKRATVRVGIPMAGRTASLGVAAAAAYLLLRTAEARRSGTHPGAKIRAGTGEIS